MDWEWMAVQRLGAALVGVLLGSLLPAEAVARWRTGRGTRTLGLRPGAYDTARRFGAAAGALVLLGDAGKTAAACAVARAALPELGGLAVIWAGLGAVAGHCYSFWHRGRGGRARRCWPGGWCSVCRLPGCWPLWAVRRLRSQRGTCLLARWRRRCSRRRSLCCNTGRTGPKQGCACWLARCWLQHGSARRCAACFMAPSRPFMKAGTTRTIPANRDVYRYSTMRRAKMQKAGKVLPAGAQRKSFAKKLSKKPKKGLTIRLSAGIIINVAAATALRRWSWPGSSVG